MFKIHEIREMIRLIDESTIECLEIMKGDSSIFLRRNGMISPALIQENKSIKLAVPSISEASSLVEEATTKEISDGTNQAAVTMEIVKKEERTPEVQETGNLAKIVSPMVGTFYKAPAEDAAPFVKIGDEVDKSTVVCILEAMKLFNEIEAEMTGEIAEVLVENGQLVEYGQPLFLVKQTS
ncbi:acetyl-CoA carboxylase biotin carboxyl carrier protein [Neobacillus sp. MER 74]|uniref:acetyl-CoA carboxylase biotin carboxyl carrier protein n=1 Tax=Neobacillus sp. MER 74 TaxID=2939566 RepID=UPI002042551A|nr:acetyl-CoA carboxylase biotin carboxyl carrier protein [Neobacillus sp. MER 74]MCM3113719.1 acetyl-CoA carboxylase biotin carboxyl carrier protein [Neobacillus sp. MER 74]